MPSLFDLEATAFARLFNYLDQPWEALTALDTYLGILLAEDPLAGTQGDLRLGARSRIEPGVHIEGSVHIGADCLVETGAYIRGPAWIGDRCEIRQGAYLRGIVLAGDGAVLGHASEFKRCVLLEGAQAPHFNYVGDSIMGIKAHIGAGVILSNVRLDKRNIRAALLTPGGGGEPSLQDTGLGKFGAILGDACEIGCNSVLNPGSILGARCRVTPLSLVKGTWPEGSAIGIG
ncbi:MAG: UDP-N-acetylglucosamine diphosphorylase [Spirochaetae bacterium HGW-Spirochaetae-9]|nr:MAG: UDP-N-acetylglucosamine diphosphorylase [Spirochaetae bacterium HGW-Spirochaetae-9]